MCKMENSWILGIIDNSENIEVTHNRPLRSLRSLFFDVTGFVANFGCQYNALQRAQTRGRKYIHNK